jgi:hypothetical protein
MGTTRTVWHVMLKTLLNQCAPRRFEVRGEVQLSSEPLRADYLLLRVVKPEDGEARTLRKLWGLLPKDTILEFKSTGRPYRARNLDKLWAYLHLHYTDEPTRLEQRGDLCGALLVPSRTQEGKRWFLEQAGSTVEGMKMSDLEGYDEAILKAASGLPPRRVLAAYTPEQRLADLTPEQRLAGLTPEQVLLALPDEILRTFPDNYLATLPEATQAAIRARLGR